MHESTISRVSRGKYLASPQGIFELRYFFSSFLHSAADDEVISAIAAKTELKKILESEDGRKPFSDEKLSQILKKRGILTARRTVAKYREALGFPSASLRKKL
ncbi:MAG: hypothetical protein LUC43_04890 [Burkholderiales bacterium]|nr:hypothetical protein [Burkholderiales bacterium]